MKHLAIFKGDAGEQILSGAKTVETRFSKSKIAPFGVISAGDLVYIKHSGGEIIGQFRVKKVIFFDHPDPVDLSTLSYLGDLGKNPLPNYITAIFIADSSRFITSPIKVSKKDLRGWMVLP